MVNMTTFFGMLVGAFVFRQSMDKVHVWIALHQDEKKERMEKEAEIRRVREQLIQENKEREPLAYLPNHLIYGSLSSMISLPTLV